MILMALGIAWLAFGKNQMERFRFYAFEQKKWANADESDRYFMAKYLVDQKMLIGKQKDEVLRLLGHPGENGVHIMLYNLGTQRDSIFPIDDDWLEVSLGGTIDGAVVMDARIRPD